VELGVKRVLLRITPGIEGSDQRRGSPVAEIAPAVPPWYER